MIAKANIKHLKISPRKLRLVLPLVRNKTVATALAVLNNTNKKAAKITYQAIHSAAANAKRFPNIDDSNLYVSKIFVDGGPVLKRFKAHPMGMAGRIRKRTSHITVELESNLIPEAANTKKKKLKAVKNTKQPNTAAKKTSKVKKVKEKK